MARIVSAIAPYFRYIWPITGLYGIAAGLFLAAMFRTGWQLGYPLDDAYIHLSIARNLSEFGSWGLSPGQFQFSSSSPLYTLLLTGLIRLFGDSAAWGLGINLLTLGGVLLWLATHLPASHRISWLVGISLLGPLPTLALYGMEHLLHIWLCLSVSWQAILVIQGKGKGGHLFLLAMACCGVRYEGLFVILAVGSLLLWHKRFLAAALAGLGGLLPIGLAGLFSWSKGGPFLPLSVLGKGHLPSDWLSGLLAWGGQAVNRLYENPFLWAMLLAISLLLFLHLNQKTKAQKLAPAWAWLSLCPAILHLGFAEVGGLRYEAYVLVLGGFAIAHLWEELPAEFSAVFSKVGGYACLLLFLFPFGVRAGYFSFHYPQSVQNIHQQQYQMAQFLRQHYPKASVAANDIGAITYFTDIKLTDLVGIGDQQVYELLLAGNYDAKHLDDLCSARQVEIAVVHPNWLGELLPANWVLVAYWQIPNNFICAEERVLWLASSPDSAENLRKRLQAFSPQLPPEILVEWVENE